MTDSVFYYMQHPKKEAYYFGSIGDGHFFYQSDLDIYIWHKKIKEQCFGFPWIIDHLDSGLLANGKIPDRPTGKVYWTCGGDPLWYAFFWWDRSEDSRPGSNSGFYVAGFKHHEEKDAFEFACQTFPSIVERQKHPLILQP